MPNRKSCKEKPKFHTLSFDLENKVEGHRKHNICIDPQ